MSDTMDPPAAPVASAANSQEQAAGAGAVAANSARPLTWRDIGGTVRRRADELSSTELFGWPDERLRVCLDACEQHHAFTTRWWMAAEVELVRRADFVEVYPELRRFGIPRSWLKRDLWRAVPRAGFWAATFAVTRTHWRRMLPGMFRPPGPGQSVT